MILSESVLLCQSVYVCNAKKIEVAEVHKVNTQVKVQVPLQIIYTSWDTKYML